MTLNLQLPTQDHAMRPVITVVGVGGAGGNAVNNMISAQLEGVQFVVANTDAQALDSALTERAIQLGRTITQGLGAGATPEIGQAAAEEAGEEIANCIEGSHMVFITAGMGGGTGTGAAPVVARMAREQGMLTVGVVTKPFQFEGGKRMRLAEQGIAELQKYVDTLIVIPNQNLFRVANEKTTFADAFRMADEVLHSGVRGVTDLMVKPGLVNLDFADIRTVMQEMGKAMMGTGEASGEKRAIEASEAAISNPLLDDVSLKGARAALINITGGSDMTLYEVDEAANRIREEIDSDANIIFGSTFHESMQGVIRVSVVATGIDVETEQTHTKPTGGNAPPRHYGRPGGNNNAGGNGQQKASFKTTSASYAGRKPSNGYTAQSSSSNYFGKDDQAIDTRHSTESNDVQHMSDARYEPDAQSVSGNSHRQETQEVPRFVPPTHVAAPAQQQRDIHRVPSPAPRPTYIAGQHRQEMYSPDVRQPVHHDVQQEDASQSDAQGQSGFNIFGKIADVGRSLNSHHARRDPDPQQQRSVEVHHRQATDVHETSSHEHPEQEEENYYDIPAFLRRQAT